MNKTEDTLRNSEGTFRFPDGSLKFIAGGADEDEEEEEEEEEDETTEDTEDEVTEEDDDDEEDEVVREAIEKALAEARSKWEEEDRLEAEKLREQEAKRAKAQKEREERNNKLLSSFPDTVKQIRENIKTIKIRDNNGKIVEADLADEFLEEQVFKPLNAFNAKGLEAASLQLNQDLTKAALEILPESNRDEFVENAADKDYEEWLKILSEKAAPTTEWGKGLEKKHKAELEAAVAAAEARGFKRGQKAPAGSTGPSSSGGSKKREKVDLTTREGLIHAKDSGAISNDEFLKRWADLKNF